MAAASDRALFLEMVKTKAMTVKEIVEMFGVAAGTARTWTQHESIETVEGSWPPAFKRKNSFSTETVEAERTIKPKSNMFSVEVPRPSKQQIEELYAKLMYGEMPEFNVTRDYMQADSPKAFKKMRDGLITFLIMVEYSESLFDNKEID